MKNKRDKQTWGFSLKCIEKHLKAGDYLFMNGPTNKYKNGELLVRRNRCYVTGDHWKTHEVRYPNHGPNDFFYWTHKDSSYTNPKWIPEKDLWKYLL